MIGQKIQIMHFNIFSILFYLYVVSFVTNTISSFYNKHTIFSAKMKKIIKRSRTRVILSVAQVSNIVKMFKVFDKRVIVKKHQLHFFFFLNI